MLKLSLITRLSLGVSLLTILLVVFSNSQVSALGSPSQHITYNKIHHVTLKAFELQAVGCHSTDGFNWCWDHTGFGIMDFAVALRLWNTTITTSTPPSQQLIARACIFRRWSTPDPVVGCFETAGRLVYETKTCNKATSCSKTAVKWIWRPRTATRFIFRHVSTWIHGTMQWTKITDWVIDWIP